MKFSIRHLLRLTFVVALVVGASVNHSPSIPAHLTVETQPDIRNALLVSYDDLREIELKTDTHSFPVRLSGWDISAIDQDGPGD